MVSVKSIFLHQITIPRKPRHSVKGAAASVTIKYPCIRKLPHRGWLENHTTSTSIGEPLSRKLLSSLLVPGKCCLFIKCTRGKKSTSSPSLSLPHKSVGNPSLPWIYLILEPNSYVCALDWEKYVVCFSVFFPPILLLEGVMYTVGNYQIMEFGSSHRWHISKASVLPEGQPSPTQT